MTDKLEPDTGHTQLTAASADEIAEALSYALRYDDRGKPRRGGGDLAARIAAERLTDHLRRDLEAIAWTMGAKVRYRPLDGCEARILGRDDQAIITVNERSAPRRRRFSLAHEIGHWTHHRGRCLVCRADDVNRGGENRPTMEKTADRYAANS